MIRETDEKKCGMWAWGHDPPVPDTDEKTTIKILQKKKIYKSVFLFFFFLIKQNCLSVVVIIFSTVLRTFRFIIGQCVQKKYKKSESQQISYIGKHVL